MTIIDCSNNNESMHQIENSALIIILWFGRFNEATISQSNIFIDCLFQLCSFIANNKSMIYYHSGDHFISHNFSTETEKSKTFQPIPFPFKKNLDHFMPTVMMLQKMKN